MIKNTSGKVSCPETRRRKWRYLQRGNGLAHLQKRSPTGGPDWLAVVRSTWAITTAFSLLLGGPVPSRWIPLTSSPHLFSVASLLHWAPQASSKYLLFEGRPNPLNAQTGLFLLSPPSSHLPPICRKEKIKQLALGHTDRDLYFSIPNPCGEELWISFLRSLKELIDHVPWNTPVYQIH